MIWFITTGLRNKIAIWFRTFESLSSPNTLKQNQFTWKLETYGLQQVNEVEVTRSGMLFWLLSLISSQVSPIHLLLLHSKYETNCKKLGNLVKYHIEFLLDYYHISRKPEMLFLKFTRYTQLTCIAVLLSLITC